MRDGTDVEIDNDRHALIPRIDALFARFGDLPYEDRRAEPVSARAHALQCAQLAEWAMAPPALVAAALLHDLGHFLAADGQPLPDDIDDMHESRAAAWLAPVLGPAVTEPIRLHVAAKRYLVATDPRYAATLSPASVHSLALQGGPMTRAEAADFIARPHAEAAVRLRRWDDLAKRPDRATATLGYYLALLAEQLPALAR